MKTQGSVGNYNDMMDLNLIGIKLLLKYLIL